VIPGLEFILRVQSGADARHLSATIDCGNYRASLTVDRALSRAQAEERIGRVVLDMLEQAARVPPSGVWR
jgi:hypothetical protein